MEQRLIDANDIPYRDYLGDDEPRVYKSQIDAMPTIDPVKHGEWEHLLMFADARCSMCGHMQFEDTDYCPNCGARMDGKNEP